MSPPALASCHGSLVTFGILAILWGDVWRCGGKEVIG